MPLVRIHDLSPTTRLGLWKMSERPEEFPDWYEQSCQRFSSEARQREFVCVRALLREMMGQPFPEIHHAASGRPLFEKGQISISHTCGYCAVILSDDCSVGVDIEHISDRVVRIAHRFLREDEIAEDVITQLLHWSAKETVYKLFSDDCLGFTDMRVTPFKVSSLDTFSVCNLKRACTVDVHYEVTSEYVLTYSFSPIC